MQTTLNKIRAHGPCNDGWQKLLKHLGKTKADNKPLSLLTVLKSNGLGDALWCLRAVDKRHEKKIRKLARDCALDVIHLWDAPPVVVKYLKTGDEKLRAAAGAAAKDGVGAAAGAAAMAAVGDGVGAAAGAAAMAAVGDGVGAAAWRKIEKRFVKMCRGKP